MWTPPERLKHEPPVERPPSADEASASRLFSPLVLASGLRLAARTWVPAMVPWRATDDGLVTPEVLAWYERFARGKPAVLVLEATGIRDVPSGPLLRIGHDRFIPGLAELARVVREASGGATRVFVQLIDFLRIRRRPTRERYLSQFLRIRPEHLARLVELELARASADESDVRAALLALEPARLPEVLGERELEALLYGERERVTDTHLSHVGELPRVLPALFAGAARRAREAGLDGVELHYAHAYTMSSFLSRRNDRSDGYGATPEGRVRLPLDVLEAVRAAVGASFTVGARILCDEIIEGGSRAPDACFYGAALARAGLDYLSLSTGGKFEDAEQPAEGEAAYPYTGKSGYECMPTIRSDARGPFGRHVEEQAAVRAAIRAAGLSTPTVAAGGIGAFALAEELLASEKADLVAAARQSLCDPDWWEKLRLGRGAEVRHCRYTNYCEALDQHHAQVTCQLWDRERLDEPSVLLSRDGRRRLVAPPWSPDDPPRIYPPKKAKLT